MPEYIVIGTVVAAFAAAGVLSAISFTPPVKKFAHKVGAIDVPKDSTPHAQGSRSRGWAGLAIFGGFLCSILIFGQLDETMLCVLAGSGHHCRAGHFRRCAGARRKAEIRGADCRGGDTGLRRGPADQVCSPI